MGIFSQLNKFSPQIANLSQHLRHLLSPKQQYTWTEAHDAAFPKLKL